MLRLRRGEEDSQEHGREEVKPLAVAHARDLARVVHQKGPEHFATLGRRAAHVQIYLGVGLGEDGEGDLAQVLVVVHEVRPPAHRAHFIKQRKRNYSLPVPAKLYNM